MRCDTGALKAYVDGALASTEQAALNVHLATCGTCRDELAALRLRAASVVTCLAALEPGADEVLAPAQALARFRSRAIEVTHAHQSEPTGLWAGLERSYTMIKGAFETGRLRPFAIGAAAVACLLILFSFAPVRQAAADILGIFRVRKFAAIAIDQTQQQKLESLAKMAEGGQFGQPATVREPGKPQPVADAAEASRLVGFAVRTPAALPNGASRQSFDLQSGPAIHYEMDRAAMQALLEATNTQGVKLPQVDKITIDVDVPSFVSQEYTIGTGKLLVIQMASPQVNIPPGIDPAVISEAGFKFLGMPDADARRLAQSIDWTSTLVIPVPINVAQYREVTVDGVSGLLLEHQPDRNVRYRSTTLLWQKGGIIHVVDARNVDPLVAMQVADSLR